jgi:hypothetical protein
MPGNQENHNSPPLIFLNLIRVEKNPNMLCFSLYIKLEPNLKVETSAA